MAFIEATSFCTKEEYIKNRGSRATEWNLQVGSLYMYMMRLSHETYHAAKQAVRVEEVARQSGLVAVRFAFLNDELEPTVIIEDKMRDGIIDGFEDAVFLQNAEDEAGFPLTEAYLRDYFEDRFDAVLEDQIKLCAPVS